MGGEGSQSQMQRTVHIGVLLSPDKEGNPAFCDNMDGLAGILPSEINERNTWDHLYVQSSL